MSSSRLCLFHLLSLAALMTGTNTIATGSASDSSTSTNDIGPERRSIKVTKTDKTNRFSYVRNYMERRDQINKGALLAARKSSTQHVSFSEELQKAAMDSVYELRKTKSRFSSGSVTVTYDVSLQLLAEKEVSCAMAGRRPKDWAWPVLKKYQRRAEKKVRGKVTPLVETVKTTSAAADVVKVMKHWETQTKARKLMIRSHRFGCSIVQDCDSKRKSVVLCLFATPTRIMRHHLQLYKSILNIPRKTNGLSLEGNSGGPSRGPPTEISFQDNPSPPSHNSSAASFAFAHSRGISLAKFVGQPVKFSPAKHQLIKANNQLIGAGESQLIGRQAGKRGAIGDALFIGSHGYADGNKVSDLSLFPGFEHLAGQPVDPSCQKCFKFLQESQQKYDQSQQRGGVDAHKGLKYVARPCNYTRYEDRGIFPIPAFAYKWKLWKKGRRIEECRAICDAGEFGCQSFVYARALGSGCWIMPGVAADYEKFDLLKRNTNFDFYSRLCDSDRPENTFY